MNAISYAIGFFNEKKPFMILITIKKVHLSLFLRLIGVSYLYLVLQTTIQKKYA
jgi:hypothetical protein